MSSKFDSMNIGMIDDIDAGGWSAGLDITIEGGAQSPSVQGSAGITGAQIKSAAGAAAAFVGVNAAGGFVQRAGHRAFDGLLGWALTPKSTE
jgi:hypothetical protein